MAWSDFYMDIAAGSNLNAGSTAGAAVFTSTAGNWNGTSIFTPTTGATTSALVSVNDWCSIYPTGNTVTPYVAQVTAVGVGANGTITLSTTMKFGTAPTSNSGSRNAKTGGAWADFGMVASGSALNTGTIPTSTRVNIKAGTYANTTTTRTLSMAGTAVFKLWWRGYKTSIGDQDSNVNAVDGTDIPLITWTTGQLSFSTASYNTFSNLSITSAITTSGTIVSSTSPGCTFYHVRIACTGVNAASQAADFSTGATLVCCYLQATTTASSVVTVYNTNAYIGCTFVGGIIGVDTTAGSGTRINDCIFRGQAGDCIRASTSLTVENCSFYSPVGNGINISATPADKIVMHNNYFESVNQASKAAINNTSGTNITYIECVSNLYYNCMSNISGISETFTIFDNGTLGAAGFTNPGAGDFSLVPAAQNLGFPGTFENVTACRGYTTHGAVQPSTQSPCGGYLGMP